MIIFGGCGSMVVDQVALVVQVGSISSCSGLRALLILATAVACVIASIAVRLPFLPVHQQLFDQVVHQEPQGQVTLPVGVL